MTSASRGRLGDRQHPQPGRLGLGLRRRALAQADAHVDARVLQVQRVGVALRAVAEDRDLAARDQRRVGVRLVVDGAAIVSLLAFRTVCETAARQARGLAVELGQRDPAGALQLDDAERAQQLLEVVELVGRARRA